MQPLNLVTGARPLSIEGVVENWRVIETIIHDHPKTHMWITSSSDHMKPVLDALDDEGRTQLTKTNEAISGLTHRLTNLTRRGATQDSLNNRPTDEQWVRERLLERKNPLYFLADGYHTLMNRGARSFEWLVFSPLKYPDAKHVAIGMNLALGQQHIAIDDLALFVLDRLEADKQVAVRATRAQVIRETETGAIPIA